MKFKKLGLAKICYLLVVADQTGIFTLSINYQNYLNNNDPLSTFQVDLVTFREKSEKGIKNNLQYYVLLCICQYTKYAFCSIAPCSNPCINSPQHYWLFAQGYGFENVLKNAL